MKLEYYLKNMNVLSLIKKTKHFDTQHGNCGSLSIALAEILGRKNVKFVAVMNTEAGEDEIWHMGIKYKNKYYDGDGETTLKELKQRGLDYENFPKGKSKIDEINADDIPDPWILDNTDYTIEPEEFIKIMLK